MDFISNSSFKQAVFDIHILAYNYHWGRKELWDMARSERRMWVKMVQMQKNAETEAIHKGNSRYTPSTYKESS